MEKVTAYKCSSCGEVSEDFIEEPLYECGNCGIIFIQSNSCNGNHQCPECHKFSPKLGENVCSSCEESEVEEIDAFKCEVCEKLSETEECEHCKEEVGKKEVLSKAEGLPLGERGGQTAFKNKEEAEVAFRLFLNAIKSNVVYLEALPVYDMPINGQTGITWIELPKPIVGFTFEIRYDIPEDKYVASYIINARPSKMFLEEVMKAAKEYLKSDDVTWNNTQSVGFVWINK